jgi:AcrR family transcriptional regulator
MSPGVGRSGRLGGASRRERVRDATTGEIKQTARRLLVEDGPDALTLRAIAREMGMTAPALYRYFGSHEELVAAVCLDILDELTATLSQARDGAGPVEPIQRLMAACRAFRRWSLDHPQEFQLTFASPAPRPPMTPGADYPTTEDLSFGAVFLGIFVEIWAHQPFPVAHEADLPPAFVDQLRGFSSAVGDVLPLGALVAYLSGWVRLYGAVTIETFGHLRFALDDPEPMFEAMLADMARSLRA